jgi:anti-sigma factor RsiW
MWPLEGPLSGHLGAAVSALVDGQLDEASADEAWAHVHNCPACRRLVERESWVKRQLSQMGGSEPSARLLGSLYELEPSDELVDAWAAVDEIERQGRGRRRVGLALVGAGSVGAAVFGLTALSGALLTGPAGTPAAGMDGPA